MKKTTETAVREEAKPWNKPTGEAALREFREVRKPWTETAKAALNARDAKDASAALAHAATALSVAVMSVETAAAACSYVRDKGEGNDPFAHALATAAWAALDAYEKTVCVGLPRHEGIELIEDTDQSIDDLIEANRQAGEAGRDLVLAAKAKAEAEALADG